MYLLLKTVHILSVTIFLGNIVTGIFWKAHADSTKDPRIQAHALAGIIRSDSYFTIPAVIAILASGVALAQSAGLPIFRTGWIYQALIAFGVSGLLFGLVLAPLQRRLLKAAQGAQDGPAWPSSAYRRMSMTWEIVGIVAILLPLAALALMVLKP